MENSYSEYDIELQKELKPYLRNNKILFHNDLDSIINRLEKFPLSGDRIDWERLEHSSIFKEKKQQNNWIQDIKTFLIEKNIPNSMSFSYFGDNLTELVYVLNFEVFIEVFHYFFSIPQHSYLISCDNNIIINYTFEDELFCYKNINKETIGVMSQN